MSNRCAVWTLGHSNLSIDEFIGSARAESIEFVVDVRSSPYSRYVSHFDREDLSASLSQAGMGYVFMGDALGGRPSRDDYYDAEQHALYEPMSREPAFIEAIDRLIAGALEHRLAIMCSCGNVETCHRRRLVGKILTDAGVVLRHIRTDGSVWVEDAVDLHDPHQISLIPQDAPWRSANPVGRASKQPAWV